MTTEPIGRRLAGALAFLACLFAMAFALEFLFSSIGIGTWVNDRLAFAFIAIPAACLVNWRISRSTITELVALLCFFIVAYWWLVLSILYKVAKDAGVDAGNLPIIPLSSPTAGFMHIVLPIITLIASRHLIAYLLPRLSARSV